MRRNPARICRQGCGARSKITEGVETHEASHWLPFFICVPARYQVFWKDFLPPISRNFFCPETDKTFFVFTDAPTIDYEEEPRRAAASRKRPCRGLTAPCSALRRFLGRHRHWINSTICVFTNANLHCMAPVHAADLLPDADKGSGPRGECRHLPYYGHNPIFHPYERRRKSRAGYTLQLRAILCGGRLNGGTASAYLAHVPRTAGPHAGRLENGVIACCHDESQLNRLVVEYSDRFRVVGPEFCVPEERPLPPGQERIRAAAEKALHRC